MTHPNNAHTPAVPPATQGVVRWIDTATSAPLTPDHILRVLADSAQQSTIIKQDERSRVAIVDSLGKQWIIKTYNIPPAKRYLYGLVNRTPALREARGSRILLNAGIRAANITAVVWHSTSHTHESIIMPMIHGKTLSVYLRSISPVTDTATRRQLAAIATSIGQQVGRMIAARIVNRDLKPSNLMLDDEALAGRAAPIILDPAGVTTRRSDSQTHRMIARLHHSMLQIAPVSTTETLRCLTAILTAADLLDSHASRADRHRLLRRWIDRIVSASAQLR